MKTMIPVAFVVALSGCVNDAPTQTVKQGVRCNPGQCNGDGGGGAWTEQAASNATIDYARQYKSFAVITHNWEIHCSETDDGWSCDLEWGGGAAHAHCDFADDGSESCY